MYDHNADEYNFTENKCRILNSAICRYINIDACFLCFLRFFFYGPFGVPELKCTYLLIKPRVYK